MRGVSGTLCQGIFRAPARGPFGTAQKGRKGRLGAAAPKNPIDVQQIAIFSFRRVDIVLPLRPLPGLRPCPSRHPNCFSPDPAPAAAGNESWVLSCKSPPDHKQQERKRNYCYLVLVGHRFTGRQAQLRNPSKFVGNPATDSVGKIAPSTTLFQKLGVLRGETPKLIFAYFCSVTLQR